MLSVDEFKQMLDGKLHGTSKEVTEDSALVQFEDVFSAAGDEADEIIKMIDDIGAEETSKILASNYHKPGTHQIVPKTENTEHSSYTSEDGSFVIYWSPKSHEVKLLAKAKTESCGGGTAAGGCGGSALFKAPIGTGTVQKRIGEDVDHEGMEDPTSDASGKDTSVLPEWIDSEAVASAAHFMFKGQDVESIKKFVAKACKDCNTTEEAINKLREMANNKHKEVAFDDKEMKSLGEYRHKLRERILGKSNDVIPDSASYLGELGKVEEDGGLGYMVQQAMGRQVGVSQPSSVPNKNTNDMSAETSNKELAIANLKAQIAKKAAELAAETNSSKREILHKDSAKLEKELSKLVESKKTAFTESTMTEFPNVYAWNAGDEQVFPEIKKPGIDIIQVLADALGVEKNSIHLKNNLEDSTVSVTLPGMTHGVVAGKIVSGSHGSKIYLDNNQLIDKALADNKNKSKVSEGQNALNFTRNFGSMPTLEEAIEILASKLGVNEMEFAIEPYADQGTEIGKTIFLELNGEKKKIADIVEGHNGWNINLNEIEFPEIESMLGKSVQDESVMTEKDDIDKKTIIGVLLTAGPEKVSTAFSTAANQSQEEFYKLLDGMDVEGLKVLSKGVQGTAANNADKGVQTPVEAPAGNAGNAGSPAPMGVEPKDSVNSEAGGDLKDL